VDALSIVNPVNPLSNEVGPLSIQVSKAIEVNPLSNKVGPSSIQVSKAIERNPLGIEVKSTK
jgi:hypothetical protein